MAYTVLTAQKETPDIPLQYHGSQKETSYFPNDSLELNCTNVQNFTKKI